MNTIEEQKKIADEILAQLEIIYPRTFNRYGFA